MNNSEQILDRELVHLFHAGWDYHKASLDPRNRIGREQEDQAIEKARAAILQHYISKGEVKQAIGKNEKVQRYPSNSNVNTKVRGRNKLRAEIRKNLGLDDKS